MSWQLGVLNGILRRVARPRLARTQSPERGAADFARTARRVFRVPPLTNHLTDQSGPVPLHIIRAAAPRGSLRARQIILYIHGGAYFAGSGQTHLALIARLSRLTAREIIAPDYRLMQDAPFPAAFDDLLAVWDHLVARGHDPWDIVLGGDSAGGGLALALLSRLTVRGQRPAGLFAFSPWTDMTLQGDSVRSADAFEVVLPVERMAEAARRYLDGAAPEDPRASPLFARFVGPPPVLLQAGSHEVLRDDAVRMADHLRAAGGEVTLQIWPGCPHVWQMFDGWLPEARAALIDASDFVQTSFDSASR
jgi:epsilon-lactone hydrolase